MDIQRRLLLKSSFRFTNVHFVIVCVCVHVRIFIIIALIPFFARFL